MTMLIAGRGRNMFAIVAILALVALAGCSSSSSPSASPTAAATTPSSASAFAVTSSIADGARLKAALPWSAEVSSPADVTSVDFLVDGKVQWTENNAPYFFNDDHYLLPPWLLGGGAHTLTVRAMSSSGKTASVTSHVSVVAAPKAPAALLATFQRKLTQADLKATASVPGYDPNSHPPTGLWSIRFKSDYLVALGDPTNPPGENEAFQADSRGDLTLAGPANWLTPPDLRGGLCEPAPLDHYHWVISGNVLTITGGSNCANRKALFDGKWTRR